MLDKFLTLCCSHPFQGVTNAPITEEGICTKCNRVYPGEVEEFGDDEDEQDRRCDLTYENECALQDEDNIYYGE